MEAWLKKSWFFQQNMFKNINDRYWQNLEESSIRDNIVFALNICYGEDHSEKKEYKDLAEKIMKQFLNHCSVDEDKKMFFSCTFINLWLIDDDKERVECVFWTEDEGKEICIDTNCRYYKSWEDFTESNMLPECHIIFPKDGKYANATKSDVSYRELICEESIACGWKSKIKKSVDVAATVGACVGCGVLALNPVSLPVTIGAITASVIGGVLSTGFAVERLVDKIEHQGLELDYQSIFAVSDVVISSLGVAAMGVTTGCKALALSEKFLYNSALVLKIGSNTATVCKALTAISGINVFVNVILEYRQKGISSLKSLKLLKLTINFIFCIWVSLPLVKKLIKYISEQSLDNVVSSLLQQANRVYSYVKTGQSILDDFNHVVQRLVPRVLPLLKRITNSNIAKFVNKIVTNIKQKGTKDPLTLIYNLMTELPKVLKEIDGFYLQSKEQVENNFGKDTCRIIKDWTSNDSIDIGNEHSSYEDKINLPVDILNKVNETVISLGITKNKYSLKGKTDSLFNAVMKLIFRHDLRHYIYTIGEASYYCEKFSEIFSKLMDYIHYEYFLYTYKNGTVDLTYYFTSGLDINEDIVDYVFNATIELLSNCIDHLHAEYDFNFRNSCYAESSGESKSVFKFQVPKGNLNEKQYYDIAIRHLPSLSSKLTKDCTMFESHFDQLAIITSNDDKFKLIFYVIENGENVDGLLMYVK